MGEERGARGGGGFGERSRLGPAAPSLGGRGTLASHVVVLEVKQAACTKGMMAMTLKEARRAGSGKRGVPGDGSEACREKGARKLLRAGVRERGVPGEGTEVGRGEGARRADGGANVPG